MRQIRLVAAALGGMVLMVGCIAGQDALPVSSGETLDVGAQDSDTVIAAKEQVVESLDAMSEEERAAVVGAFASAHDLQPALEQALLDTAHDPESFYEVLSVELPLHAGAAQSVVPKCIVVGWYCIADGLELYVGPSYWVGSWLCHAAGGTTLVPACV